MANATVTEIFLNSPRISSLVLVLGVLFVHRLIITVYRLFFSPLAKFPGPKLAAASNLYEQYYNFIKTGAYVFKVAELHDAYVFEFSSQFITLTRPNGPIVRVNPHELSIRDPQFYDKLYVSASVRATENYNRFVDGIDFEGSHFLTTPHDLHRSRRKPLEPYFSRQGITHFEPVIQELALKLDGRLRALEGTRSIVRLDHALVCYTGDMISRVCCENTTSLLDAQDFSKDWYDSLHTIIRSMPLFEALPWLIRVVRLIPKSVLTWLDPRSQLFNDWRDMAEGHVVKIKAAGKRTDPASAKAKRTTVLHDLIYSDMAKSELNTPRLVNEAQVLLAAGTIGTARVLDLMCYYIIANPSVHQRLREELTDVMAGYPLVPPTWAQLESLPYMQAVIKEGLRLSYGVMRRLPRVSPKVAIQYQEFTIPPGIPVGMSAYMQHTDPSIFPDPFAFKPERWLPDQATQLMHRNLVPFTKGSRICLGMNLATAEINHLLAVLFRTGGPKFELFETDESDVKLVHDFVTPMPCLDSKGLRIIFN